MRRLAPRPLAMAVDAVGRAAAPQTVLARVQGCWSEVAGPTVALEAEPSAEREGVVTVTCRSSVWANELELLGGDLAIRLNARIGSPDGPPPVRRLRFVTGRTGSAG